MGKIDARGWITEISDGAATPTWNETGGVNSWTDNLAENEEEVDTTDFNSQGQYESQAIQRGATLSIEGFYATTTDEQGNVVRDPGQKLAETAASKVGDASLYQVRFRHKTQNEWTVWTAWISIGEQGGETNAKTSWAVTLHKSGPASTQPMA